jgi:hypothetical protein
MRLLAAILATVSTATFASSTTTDYSDIWYNANEPGWGLNIVHQADTLFATLFVYGQNSQPTWYVASGATQVGSTPSFTGTLYSATGPYFGAGTFNGVTLTTTGTLTFTATGVNSANLSYSVNGVTVNKAITRNTFRGENLAGTYLGSSLGTWSNCGTPRNGYVEALAAYTVSHDANNSVQIREEGNNFQCSYVGTYTQNGRYGSIAGGGLCSDGTNQTFSASEVVVSRDALTMKFNIGQIGGCNYAGRLGGVRRGP